MKLRSVAAMFLALFLTLVVAEDRRYRKGRQRLFNNFDDEDPDHKRPSRGNMMAFPRVGRADAWIQNERNRMNILPLRTGTNELTNWDVDDGYEKRELFRRSSENKAGLWFGPRMGRVHKRNTGNTDDELPWATIIINGIPIPPRFIYNSNPSLEPANSYQEKEEAQ